MQAIIPLITFVGLLLEHLYVLGLMQTRFLFPQLKVGKRRWHLTSTMKKMKTGKGAKKSTLSV